MNSKGDTLSKKKSTKKKVVSLTDNEYSDLFESVIYPTLSQGNNSELNIQTNSSFSTIDTGISETNVHTHMTESSPIKTNRKHTTDKKFAKENRQLTNKKVSKFNAPLKGNSSQDSTNLPQDKSKKYGSSNPKSATKPFFLSNTAKENFSQNSISEATRCTKFQTHEETDIYKKDVSRSLADMTMNKAKYATVKKLHKITEKLSGDVKRHFIGSGSKNVKNCTTLNTVHKETESEGETRKFTEKKQNKQNIHGLCVSSPSRKICIHKTNRNNTHAEQATACCSRFVNSKESLETDTDLQTHEIQNIALSQASDKSFKNITISQSSCTQLSQPPPGLTQRKRMEWLRTRRDVGVWVQCCRLHCSKWRYLEDVKDPIVVPEYWVCHMNNDPLYNKCDKPEKGPRLTEQVDLINNKYTAGSVVWARVCGFPWWPALVDDDPDVEAYYWLNGFSDIPTHYHVVFFDEKEVTRAWVTPSNIYAFTGDEKDKKFNVKFFHGVNYSSRIEAAKKQAKSACALDMKDRLLQHGFLARYKGSIGKKKSSVSEDQNRQNFTSESDTDTDGTTDDENDNISEKNKKLKRIYQGKFKRNEKRKSTKKISQEPKRKRTNNDIIFKTNKHKKQSQLLKSKAISENTNINMKKHAADPEKTQLFQKSKTSSFDDSNLSESSYTVKVCTRKSKESKKNANTHDKNSIKHSHLPLEENNDKQHCNKEKDLNEKVIATNSNDIDPFKEKEPGNNLPVNSKPTEEESAENEDKEYFNSNLATVGTNIFSVPLVQQCASKDSSSSTKQKFPEVETQEADTSEDATLSLVFRDMSNDNSDEVVSSQTECTSHNREDFDYIPHLQNNLFHGNLQTMDAVVPDLSSEMNYENDSDPFEEDD